MDNPNNPPQELSDEALIKAILYPLHIIAQLIIYVECGVAPP